MAPPVMAIDGDVVAVHSHWTLDRSRIVTEATLRTAEGEEVVISQLGGSADGLRMITMPGPPILVPGMRVAVIAHKALDLAQHEHVVLDSVKVLEDPPEYVRSTSEKLHRPLYWASGCAFVTVDAAGTTAIPGDDEFAIIDAAINTWNNDTASCSYLKVINENRKAMEVGDDRINVIKFRDTTWGRPAIGTEAPVNHPPAAAAVTTMVMIDDPDDPSNPRNGEILDSDIEINGVNFAISVNGLSMSSAGCKADLQNTLTHELGHLLGLQHTCLAPGDPPRVDNLGNPVPSCSGPLPPSITEATMYNFQVCGETKKTSLSPDDINGICEIYPTSKDPDTCDHAGTHSGGCCSAAGHGADRPAWSFLTAGSVLLLLLRRRRALPGT